MQVGECMSLQPVTVSEQTSMREAVELMRRHQIRHLPVVQGKRLLGIVTDRDIRRASPSLLSGISKEEYEEVLDSTPVSRIMTREPFTVTPETDLAEAVRILLEKKVGGVPVVNGQELVGILTESDALRVLLEKLREIPRPTPK